ncbi:Uncharacterised protein [Bordetella pertussis]|nr:Uncharacterised protein [Bordetella pertussis]
MLVADWPVANASTDMVVSSGVRAARARAGPGTA